jgi:hypothetical protein
MSPSPRPRLIAFATLSQSVRTVHHLDLSRLDRAMGLRRSWQKVVQRWRDQKLVHAQEVQQAHRQTDDRVAAIARDPGKEELFPAEHPFIRLEPATLPNDTPHICATDGTPLFKGNVSNALLHTYAHPSALRRQARPDQSLPGFVQNRGNNYVPFITTYNGIRQPVNFVQTILTPDPLVIGICKDSDFVFAKPLHATPEYLFGERPIYVLEDLEGLDEGHARAP